MFHILPCSDAILLFAYGCRYGKEEFCNESKSPTVSFSEVKECLLKLCVNDQRNPVSNKPASELERGMQNSGSQTKSGTTKTELSSPSPELPVRQSGDSCLYSALGHGSPNLSGARSPLRTVDRNVQCCSQHQDINWKRTRRSAQIE